MTGRPARPSGVDCTWASGPDQRSVHRLVAGLDSIPAAGKCHHRPIQYPPQGDPPLISLTVPGPVDVSGAVRQIGHGTGQYLSSMQLHPRTNTVLPQKAPLPRTSTVLGPVYENDAGQHRQRRTTCIRLSTQNFPCLLPSLPFPPLPSRPVPRVASPPLPSQP